MSGAGVLHPTLRSARERRRRPSDSCSYVQTLNQMPTGAVVVNGQQVTFKDDAKPDAVKEPGEFCVRGNSLTVKDSDGSVYSAVRQ
jgi:hypothetical protein